MRTEPRSRASGATEASAHASATIASAAGAIAVTRGSVVSGTASVSRAAQVWTGMAPNRIATASANARYAQPEDDRLGGEFAQVATEPCCSRDRHRAGDGRRSQDPRPDGRGDAAADGRQRHERPERTASRRREDRDARVGQRQRESRRRQDPERDGRRVAPAAGGLADDRQQQGRQRPEDEEQAQVIGRRDAAAADLDDLARPDEQSGHDRGEQRQDADAGRDSLAAAEHERRDRAEAGHDQERQQAHRRVPLRRRRADARRARGDAGTALRG